MDATEKMLLDWLRSLSSKQLKEIKSLLLDLEELRISDPNLFVRAISDIKHWSNTYKHIL